jgi:hypothetical protein
MDIYFTGDISPHDLHALNPNIPTNLTVKYFECLTETY